MTQITEEMNVPEQVFFLMLRPVCRDLDIDLTSEKTNDDIMLEIARKTSTKKLIEMVAGYVKSTSKQVKEMTEIMIKELKTRGVLED